MAGRVNTRFVLVLSGVLVALFVGVLAAGWYIKTHNAPDLVKAGDAKMAAASAKLAAGDSAGASVEYEAAEKLFSKAVNKQSTNVEYLIKWRDCLKAWTPLTQTNYIEKFSTVYPAAHRQVALVKRTDVQAHRDYLDLLPSPTSAEFNRRGAEYTIGEVERTLNILKAANADTGPAQVLRRYRGLTLVRMMGEGIAVPPEQVQLAKEDLVAARAVDPEDAGLVSGLYQWNSVQAEAARKLGKSETADGFDDDAKKVLTEALAARPNDPELLTLRLIVDVGTTQRKAAATLTGNDLAAHMQKIAPTFKEPLETIESAFVKSDPRSITVSRLGRFQDLEAFVDPKAAWSRSIGLIRRALEQRPDDPELLTHLATMLSEHNDLEEAIALLQRIVDLPQRPLSPAGARLYGYKAQAIFNQAAYSLQRWELAQAQDPKAAAEALDQARQYRAKLTPLIGSDTSMALYVDAMLKFAEKDWPAAKRMFVDYNGARVQRPHIKALWTQARVELALDNPGAARQILTQITQLRPDLAGPQVLLAQIDVQFKDPKSAKDRLEAVLAVEPDNKAAKELLERIKITQLGVKSDDPVVATILEAQRLLDGTDSSPPDVAGAQAMLEQAIKDNAGNPRLYVALVMLQAQNNDRPGALATAKAGLASNPDNKDLAEAIGELGASDPFIWRLKKIDESSAPEIEKELERYRMYAGAGKAELATAALERAAKLAPEDPRVVEQMFRSNIRAKDFGAAAKQVELAVARDLDGCGGAFYKGRLLAAQGQTAEGAAVLKEVADRKSADVDVLRLLARLYIVLGRSEDSDSAFKEALRLRPNDTGVLLDYVGAVTQRGELPAALALAREYERVGVTNPAFLNLLLNLEAAVGLRAGYPDPSDPEKDPVKKRVIKGAVERREDLYKRDPANATNTLALARLYIDLKRWDDARRLIDLLRAGGDSLDVAVLDVRYHAGRGDLAKARGVMDDFISRQGSAVTADPFIAFGQLLGELGRPEDAIAMLERGRDFQNPTTAGAVKINPVDRLLGDLLVSLGRYDKAVEAYKRVIDSGADGPRQEVRLRLVELLISAKQFEEASAQMQQIKSTAPDAAMSLLRADIAAGLGDEKKARQIYDQAVAGFPREPMVYFRRATWTLAKGPAGIPDALVDLDASLRVSPNFWQGRRLRALLLAQQNRPDEAIKELREAIKANPRLDDLRLSLMNDLINRGRAGEALEIGEEAVRTRPNDLDLFLSCASVFSQRLDWSKAERFVSSAWALDKKRSDIAQAYLDTLLNVDPPKLALAQAVLTEVAGQIDGNSGLLVARAKLIAKRRALGDAVPDLLASMNVVPLEPDSAVLAWFVDVRRLVTKPTDAVALLERQEVPERFKDWALYLKASALTETDRRAGAQPLLEQFLVAGGTSAPYRMGYRLYGTLLYQDGRYADAVRVWGAGLDRFPDDWELLNNVAYTLARYANQSEQALPYAERAVKAAPQSGEALDTLGYIQMMIKRLDEAEVTFRRAYAASRSVFSRVQVELHLAQLYLLKGKKDKAKEQLDAAESVLRDNPKEYASHKKELEELKAKLDSP